ncbi:AzlD domain-containing protein [Acuticoccus sediminis]|uniref:AzlD domain-containing protein n=1 Tax=Acuticoccus sediminis TaxID=2184697 RepID=A0A8B2NVG4_9HYPH|nr:AzlD domain-containing protein [Acuticoccus sediminis]RAI02308.1 AzlD domain-containing protein [Acuticoccus sediminis]
MNDGWWLILGLAAGTFGLRLGGYVLGTRLPTGGTWARSFAALPGTLIAALVTVTLLKGGPTEWAAAAVALAVAVTTRSLPLTMAAGIVVVWSLRTAFGGA